MNKPAIGRIVHYKFSEDEKKALRCIGMYNNHDFCAATIVAVWSDTCVNLKLCIDAPVQDLHKASVTIGEGDSQWNWPVIN